MFCVGYAKPLRANRSGNHRSACRPCLQNLQARSAPREQGHNGYLGARQFRYSVLYFAYDLDSRVSRGYDAQRLRVLADQPPHQPWMRIAQLRPDFAAEEAD